jgi:hypothetical protein
LSCNVASNQRLRSRTAILITKPLHPLHGAACRFSQEIDVVHDCNLKADVYYHQSCYIRYESL